MVRELQKRLRHETGVIWTDSQPLNFRFDLAFKKQNQQAKLFIDTSEFLDIHRFNKGNFLQRQQGDVKQRSFEQKTYFAYDGTALMTLALVKYYKNFPKPQPKFLPLPLMVVLERFQGQKEPLPEFQSPYIAFVGVMNDAKDGVSNLIKAFNTIKDKFPSHKVFFVGGWNYDTHFHL